MKLSQITTNWCCPKCLAPKARSEPEIFFARLLHDNTILAYNAKKDVLELCPRSFDVFLQVGFVVENPKPKQQVEQGLNMDRINKINDWFWNPV